MIHPSWEGKLTWRLGGRRTGCTLARLELQSSQFVHLVFKFGCISESLTLVFPGLQKCRLGYRFVCPIITEQLRAAEEH